MIVSCSPSDRVLYRLLPNIIGSIFFSTSLPSPPGGLYTPSPVSLSSHHPCALFPSPTTAILKSPPGWHWREFHLCISIYHLTPSDIRHCFRIKSYKFFFIVFSVQRLGNYFLLKTFMIALVTIPLSNRSLVSLYPPFFNSPFSFYSFFVFSC